MNMVKKINYSEADYSEAYKAYATYKLIQGVTVSKEKFDSFRFRKSFLELGKKYPEFNCTIPIEKYTSYLKNNNVPSKKWCDLNTFRDFLLTFTKEESMEDGCKRSEEFLKSKNQSINTISDTRLILYLESGNISPWYILKEYPEFFDYINSNNDKSTVYCRNLMTYYFWKLKAQQNKIIID